MFPLTALGLSFAALLYGVFAAPYAIPRHTPVVSAATLTDYNNSAAHFIYGILVIATGFALANLLQRTSAEPSAVIVHEMGLRPTPTVWAVLGGHLVVFLTLFMVKGYFVFGDGLYFQHILARMASGAVLYRDVNFLYGPIMVYPAYWLSRAIGVTTAYGVYYVAVYLAGIYLLWLCLQAVQGCRPDTDRAFVLLSVGLFNLLLGMNYVFPRHLLPLAAVLLAWRCVEQPRSGCLIATSGITLLALSFSLEMGALAVASILGLGCIRVIASWLNRLVASAKHRAAQPSVAGGGPATMVIGMGRSVTESFRDLFRLAAVSLAALVGWGVMFYAIDPSFQALFESVRPVLSYSAGGGNTPIYLSLPMLSVLGVSVVVVAFLARALLSKGCQQGMDLVLTLLVLALITLRPAFGKPDAPHIAYGGLPLFLTAMLIVPARMSWMKPRTWIFGVLLLGVMVPLQVFNLSMMKPVFERKLAAWRTPEVMASVEQGSKTSIQRSLRRVIVHFGDKHPYYLHILAYYSLPAILEFRLKQVPYVVTLEETFTSEEIAKVIRELHDSQAIVISRRADLLRLAQPAYGGWEGVLYQLTASPLPGSRVFAEITAANAALREPLREFLVSSYDVVFEDGELVGLIPRRSSGQERM